MSADCKPGTLAVATVRGVSNVRVFRNPGGWWSVAERGPRSETIAHDRHVSEVRPLVVLDVKDVPGLLATLRDSLGFMYAGQPNALRLQDAIDQIESQTMPPKPAEPTGWLAAVVDAEGNRWGRPGGPTDGTNEWYSPDLNARRDWHDIDVVAVLSDGWEPKP